MARERALQFWEVELIEKSGLPANDLTVWSKMRIRFDFTAPHSVFGSSVCGPIIRDAFEETTCYSRLRRRVIRIEGRALRLEMKPDGYASVLTIRFDGRQWSCAIGSARYPGTMTVISG